MHRRAFLALPLIKIPGIAPKAEPFSSEDFFQKILGGFLTAARHTSSSYAVCEFPDATVTTGFRAASGLSVTACTRMLPAMAAWVAGGRDKSGLGATIASMLACGTDPKHPDYWGAADAKAGDQRQVEASLVAWSVWILRQGLLPSLSPEQRKNLNDWLTSCTQVPVRANNWAWFTAVNQAARIDLSKTFPEFKGDPAAMLEDIKALDAMAVADSGWYNDGGHGSSFDYYNSWVFASHFLYWNAIAGTSPELGVWPKRFAARLHNYLNYAPYFFASNGAHVLYGRSLIYRFAVLTPLLLAYVQGLWPYSPGMLRRIVMRSLAYHDEIESFDPYRGALRETYSSRGSRNVCESYIDGGHPYWAMQAFALWFIPQNDPFWTVPEEFLPAESLSYSIPLKEAGLLLQSHPESGQVRVYQSLSTRIDPDYRDKYNKTSYSSHFGFAILNKNDRVPWDNALVLQDKASGAVAGRGEVIGSAVDANRLEMAYPIQLNGVMARVRTQIWIQGEMEARRHEVTFEVPPPAGLVLIEGGPALGLRVPDEGDENWNDDSRRCRDTRSGSLVAAWSVAGWQTLNSTADFGVLTGPHSSVLHARQRVLTLRAEVAGGRMVLDSVHYASPRPSSWTDLKHAAKVIRAVFA
jgi:hypothetical protein